MKKFLAVLSILALFAACNEKVDPDPAPADAPTSITVNPTSLSAAADGGRFEVNIVSPSRPNVEIPSEAKGWLTLKDGIYNDYKITVGLVLAANGTYDSRSAEVSVSADGVSTVKITVTQEGKVSVPDPELADNDAVRLSRTLALGWNMGNHFDAYYNGSWAGAKEGYPDEEVWGGAKATQATFYGVKKAGFTTVRIPVSWLKMIGDAPDYTIDKTWLDRVCEVVGFAHNAGLYVVINTHHDENHGVDNTYQWQDIKHAVNDSELNTAIKEKIHAVWTQIANRFSDCGDWLIMEGFNEINDGGWGWSEDFRSDPTRQCGILNDWNQVFVNAVRATGGNNATRWLGCPTYAANPEFEKYFKLPSDPAGKTMMSVHFYDPSDYTIGEAQYTDWGHTGVAGRKAAGGDEDHVKDVFNNLYTKYVAKNIPVYIGEFGCSVRAKTNDRAWKFYLYYMEYVVKAAKTFGLPCILWDNGAEGDGQERHGYIHHGTGDYIGNSKAVIDVMVNAWWDDDASYTLQSVYDNAPQL